MRKLIEQIGRTIKSPGYKAAGLPWFQTKIVSINMGIQYLYAEVLGLKAEFDRMDEVSSSAKKVADRIPKILASLREAQKLAHQSKKEIRRMR